MMNTVGLVHYLYGFGAGKTTSIMGLLMRAVGQGMSVALIQFLKHSNEDSSSGFSSGELSFLKVMQSQTNSIHIRQFGRAGFIRPEAGPQPTDFRLAQEGLSYARDLIRSEKFDVVALDEILDTIYFGLIRITEIAELVQTKPKDVEIILSGHQNYPEIQALADYVTEFKLVKHPYENGICARKGIEY